MERDGLFRWIPMAESPTEGPDAAYRRRRETNALVWAFFGPTAAEHAYVICHRLRGGGTCFTFGWGITVVDLLDTRSWTMGRLDN